MELTVAAGVYPRMVPRWGTFTTALALLMGAWLAAPCVALARPSSTLLARLLSWTGDKGSATVYDRRCRAIYVVKRGDALYGHVSWDVQISGNEKSVSARSIAFGLSIIEYGTDHWQYEHSNDARWLLVETSGTSDAADFHVRLSQVSKDAAWYDLARTHSKTGVSYERKKGVTHPYLFRTLDACRKYRREHKITRADLQTW